MLDPSVSVVVMGNNISADTPRQSRRWIRLVVVGVVATASEAAVEAGPNEDAARDATKRGAAAYNLGKYDEAAREYEQAYRLVPDVALLFNVAQSYRLGGQHEKALTAYRSYLRTSPANAPSRRMVEEKLGELERIVAGTGKGQTPPPASTLPQAATSPAPAPNITVNLIAPTTERPPESPVYARWWFWTIVGAVAVAGGTAAFLVGRHAEDPVRGNADPGVVVVR